jgi:CheY-like chemotaxis protein
LSTHYFTDYQVIWAKNAMAALTLVQQHTATLALIVLDICLPVLDGGVAAAQFRALAPRTPIMPFTANDGMLPGLMDLGCVLPIVKQRVAMADIPAQMEQAMQMPVPSLPDAPWVTMAQRQALALLAFAQATDPVNAEVTVTIPLKKAQILKHHLKRIGRDAPHRSIRDVIDVLDRTI